MLGIQEHFTQPLNQVRRKEGENQLWNKLWRRNNEDLGVQLPKGWVFLWKKSSGTWEKCPRYGRSKHIKTGNLDNPWILNMRYNGVAVFSADISIQLEHDPRSPNPWEFIPRKCLKVIFRSFYKPHLNEEFYRKKNNPMKFKLVFKLQPIQRSRCFPCWPFPRRHSIQLESDPRSPSPWEFIHRKCLKVVFRPL